MKGEAKMRESLVERKLKDEVEKAGGLCWKFTSTTDGVPDRIILLYPGRVIFAETKAEGGTGFFLCASHV